MCVRMLASTPYRSPLKTHASFASLETHNTNTHTYTTRTRTHILSLTHTRVHSTLVRLFGRVPDPDAPPDEDRGRPPLLLAQVRV